MGGPGGGGGGIALKYSLSPSPGLFALSLSSGLGEPLQHTQRTGLSHIPPPRTGSGTFPRFPVESLSGPTQHQTWAVEGGGRTWEEVNPAEEARLRLRFLACFGPVV